MSGNKSYQKNRNLSFELKTYYYFYLQILMNDKSWTNIYGKTELNFLAYKKLVEIHKLKT